MKLTQHINPDRLIVVIGGGFLVLLVLSSWIPASCPLLRKAIIGCPVTRPYVTVPLTAEEKEIARVPHQEIPTDSAIINLKEDPQRSRTSVGFEYREKDLSLHPIAFLQAQEGDHFVDIALVTHPLLETLSWPAVANEQYRVYQRNGAYGSLSDFSAHLPPAASLAADTAAAAFLGLNASQYQDLENLDNLDGVDYVLTTYQPVIKDGQTWNEFRKTFDLTAATPDDAGNLHLSIRFPHRAETSVFLLGTVSIDYVRDSRTVN